MTRERLPDRRRCFTQKATIDRHTFHVTVGEFHDGRPGELFIDSSKQGTFARGCLGALARMASLALQCGASVEEVVHSLCGLNFPPNGPVEHAGPITDCASVADWIGKMLEAIYLCPAPSVPEKVAGAKEGSGFL